jgi:hypothetical protein
LGEKQKELAKKLRTKSETEVLKQMTGNDIVITKNKIELHDNLLEDPSQKTGKGLLLKLYKSF